MAYTAGVISVIFLANILLRVLDLIFLLLIGILLATAIDPAARRLRRLGLNRPASILSIYLLVAVIIGTMLAFIIPPLVAQATDFATNLPRVADHLERRYGVSDKEWIRNISHNAAEKLREWSSNPPDISGVIKDQALNVVSSVFGALLSVVTVILISFYWMTERTLIRRALLSFAPVERRERINEIWSHIETKLGHWFRAQLILCGIIGVASGIAFFILDVQYWPLLAIFAGVTEIIPILGPWIGGIPAVLLALTDGPVKALIVAAFIIVLQQVEGNILVPRIQGDAIGLSPLTVILAILAGTSLAGPIGGILAVPIAAIIQVIIQDLVIARQTPEGDDIDRLLDAADAAEKRGENGPEAAFRLLRRMRAVRQARIDPQDDIVLDPIPAEREPISDIDERVPTHSDD
jgi:predicted PurR-regulated permease PerM